MYIIIQQLPIAYMHTCQINTAHRKSVTVNENVAMSQKRFKIKI